MVQWCHESATLSASTWKIKIDTRTYLLVMSKFWWKNTQTNKTITLYHLLQWYNLIFFPYMKLFQTMEKYKKKVSYQDQHSRIAPIPQVEPQIFKGGYKHILLFKKKSGVWAPTFSQMPCLCKNKGVCTWAWALLNLPCMPMATT